MSNKIRKWGIYKWGMSCAYTNRSCIVMSHVTYSNESHTPHWCEWVISCHMCKWVMSYLCVWVSHAVSVYEWVTDTILMWMSHVVCVYEWVMHSNASQTPYWCQWVMTCLRMNESHRTSVSSLMHPFIHSFIHISVMHHLSIHIHLFIHIHSFIHISVVPHMNESCRTSVSCLSSYEIVQAV